jgi:glycosyltransferase involved in cell wall biosynthesis
MRVLLHENQICERGTTQAVIDYAHGLNELGHEVAIAYPIEAKANVPKQIDVLSEQFTLLPYGRIDALREMGQEFDAAYFIKGGEFDGKDAGPIRTVVHAVFQNYDPHGDHYAYVSQWLADHMRRQALGPFGRRREGRELGRSAEAQGCSNALDFSWIPHACDMPDSTESVRSRLAIPDEAFVILRYGGFQTFDVDWAQGVIDQQLRVNPDWYFIGVNTEPFTTHERALFLPPVISRQEKANLLGSADVFMTARREGESFGLSHVEALQMGLPVLAWSGGRDRNHVEMLSDIHGLYRDPKSLVRDLRNIRDGAGVAGEPSRRARGDEFRPAKVVPLLEQALKGNSAYFDKVAT